MEKKQFIIDARSKKNGIVFYSNLFPFIGVQAFFDNYGNIKSKLIDKELDEFVDYVGTLNEGEKTLNKKKLIILDSVLILFSIIGCIFSGNFGLVLGSIFFSIFVSKDLYRFSKACYNMNLKDEKQRSTAMFHAAEHMVLNAYQTLKRIPSLEEAKKFSRFSKLCGSRAILSRMFMFSLITIAMFSILHYNNIIYLISVLSIVMFVVKSQKYGWLNFLQVFVTSKPTDKEIELAIEGLKQFEIMEKKIEDGEEICFSMELPENFPFIPMIITDEGK